MFCQMLCGLEARDVSEVSKHKIGPEIKEGLHLAALFRVKPYNGHQAFLHLSATGLQAAQSEHSAG